MRSLPAATLRLLSIIARRLFYFHAQVARTLTSPLSREMAFPPTAFARKIACIALPEYARRAGVDLWRAGAGEGGAFHRNESQEVDFCWPLFIILFPQSGMLGEYQEQHEACVHVYRFVLVLGLLIFLCAVLNVAVRLAREPFFLGQNDYIYDKLNTLDTGTIHQGRSYSYRYMQHDALFEQIRHSHNIRDSVEENYFL